MARLRLSLYGKILLWFCLNLVVLAMLGLWFMSAQFRLGLDSMLAGLGGERLERLADSLTNDLRNRPESEWASVLQRRQDDLGLTLALFGSDGRQKLGTPLDVPDEALPKLTDKRSASDMPPPPRV